ncbi:MAG TPA: class A beta-lactamase-related serine hydrolase [Deltaproteobacteria bacterium]|nr:class A beta-lactamase-related serine hydrolase [Candidatus Binatota bacterium]HIL14161.1 class A beta-lactamase-related serine hydrolase [Deltaproteobacteria bacterium]
MAMSTVNGHCDPRLDRLRQVFEANFTDGCEIGAAVAVVENGEVLASLWGGSKSPGGEPWQEDTIVNVFSTTKGMVALAVQVLVDRGKISLDSPVADYWPEFAAAGKQDITVAQLMSHQAGLAAVRQQLEADAGYDWDGICAVLAAEKPWWTPGEKHGYHAISFGWLGGELVRRVDGRDVATFIREEIAAPSGADFYLGFGEELDARCAEMGELSTDPVPAGEPNLVELMMSDLEGLTARAFTNPPALMQPGAVNSRAWRGAQVPGANGHSSALSLARIYGNAAGLLSAEAIATCGRELAQGPDAVLELETRFSVGFMLPQPHMSFGSGEGSFGHAGAGGSLAFYDPERRLGFAYVMNRMGPHILLDPRAYRLVDAIYGEDN